MRVGRKLGVLVGMLLCSGVGSAYAAPDASSSTGSTAQQTEKKPAPKFLFVLHAKKGAVTALPGQPGHYRLTLSQGDVDRVIVFSDRPNRIVKMITADQLKSSWKVGKNSFKDDPPNAVLSATGHLPAIIELIDMACLHWLKS